MEESRRCQNCKKNFVIEPEDFKFYEKIDVPPPTWCPECRLQRRLVFLNHRTLYKRKCNLCSKSIISLYDQDATFPVYCPDCYWSDKWDAKSYGRDYNFSVPFFEQFKKLSQSVPHISLMALHATLVNSEYNNLVSELKNCYLIFNSDYNEGCAYGSEIEHSKECFDNTMIDSCELCYEGVNLMNCYNTHFSVDCENCQNVWFSKNCVGCTDCVGCANLRNKKYHIFNQPFTKEEYTEKLKELSFNSRDDLAKIRERAAGVALGLPNKFIHGKQNTDVSGDYINHSKNVHNTHIATESQDCRYCLWLLVKPVRDCYDYSQFGDNAERIYESLVCGRGVKDVKFSSFCVDNVSSTYYSEFCYNAENLFGCSFMQRSNKFCILNKQYSEKEYREVLPKVIKHMNDMPYTDKDGKVYKFGEFFPPELSPFAYNESMALEFFPFTEEEAVGKGYSWKETETRNYQVTIKKGEVPDEISKVDDSILGEVIECAHQGRCNEQCSQAFKVVSQELQFYRRLNLPLPELCPNCRSFARGKKRNPDKLWSRKCTCMGEQSENGNYKNTVGHFHGKDRCPNEFETSYSPDREEIVYCEQCYQSEVV